MAKKDPVIYVTGNKTIDIISYILLIAGVLCMIFFFIVYPFTDLHKLRNVNEMGEVPEEDNFAILCGSIGLITGLVLYLLLQSVIQIRVKKLIETLNQ